MTFPPPRPLLPLSSTIGARMFRLILTLYLGMAALITMALIADEYLGSKQDVVHELKIYERSFQGALAGALWALDRRELESIISGMIEIPNVVGVKILDHTSKRSLITAGRVSESDEAGLAVIPGLFSHQFPIRYQHETGIETVGVGVIYSSSEIVLQRVQSRIVLILFSSLIKTAALWAVFVYVSRRLLSGPLARLTEAAAALDPDKPSREPIDLGLKDRSELTILQDTFNEMARRLHQSMEEKDRALAELRHSNEALERLRDSLEQQVIDRTAALAESEQKFRAVTETALEAIILADPQGRIAYWNPAASAIFQYERDEVMGKPLHGLITVPSDAAAADAGLLQFARHGGGAKVGRRTELVGMRRDGSEFPADIAIAALQLGGEWWAVGVVRDVTQQKAQEAELRMLANTDGLTGLLNRRSFTELSDKEISRARRSEMPISVLIMDIDLFKRINDNFGHHSGDRVIVTLATITAGLLRSHDLCGRIGGEEFALLLPDTDLDGACFLAERIRATIAHTALTVDGMPMNFTVSIGVAEMRDDECSLEPLLKRADAALYQAKEAGRDQVMSAA